MQIGRISPDLSAWWERRSAQPPLPQVKPIDQDDLLARTIHVNRKAKEPLTPEALREAMEESAKALNKTLEYINTRLSFQIHEETDRLMARIIDVKTLEVIKEMPPEEFLDLIARIREMVGLLIDERA